MEKIKMSKKKIFGTLAMGGLILSAPLAVFADSENEINQEEYKKIDKTEIYNLTEEEHLELMKEQTQLKIEHLTTIINILENEGIDISEFNSIVDDYIELNTFLNSVNVDETTKEELREAFFELKPDREEIRELKIILRNTFEKKELQEIRSEHKIKMDNLREKYNLPEINHRNKSRTRGGLIK
jgi:hypothetical protein